MNNRRQQIVELLHKHTFLKVQDFCTLLNVSPATLRRDLTEMENAGVIVKIPGGAVLRKDNFMRGDFAKESRDEDAMLPYKKAIASAVSMLVNPGDTIFIDYGSTNSIIAEYLVSLPELVDITIVTNSIDIAYKFMMQENTHVYVCGGARPERNSKAGIVGPLAEQMISQLRANICFIGTPGIDIKSGITDPYLSAANIKAKMIENSQKVVLAADHSKFGKAHTAYVCSLDEINHLITDDAAPTEYITHFKNMGAEVTIVKPIYS
ncbi:DeoR/GlpR family DNA-binding transcription regulator [Paenibacillus piri]|uniref:DeoR/GlpR transcriptional regulator n=1 Tax=Paenibacillus piri TaxID=2547395 RepID=A0A4R5K998_9BACL|nr:DeoR/GlpR family DNA-binding transcription regulator [Paenibacillus piri]TDF91713.1 DeoR/GlpR transcriptional regulator [Paenibacillus piri]